MSRILFSPFVWKSFAGILPVILLAGFLGGWLGVAWASLLCFVLLVLWRARIVRQLERSGLVRDGVLRYLPTRGAAAAPERGSEKRPRPARDLLPYEIGRVMRRLADDHDRMDVVLSTIRDGVIALDATGRITLVNAAVEELLAASVEEWPGRRLEEVCDNPVLIELAREGLAAAGGIRKGLHHKGRNLQIYVTPVDAATRVVIVIRDVTEVYLLERMRRDFVANVSHELKTPLTAIKAYVETLLGAGLDDREVNLRFMEKIALNANRLSALIGDLLTLSRIESGVGVGQRSRVNLSKIVQESVQRLGPSAEDKNIRLSIAAENGLEVLGDREAVQQILDNLLSNAIRYTEPGGIVTIAASREDPMVRVEVRDTGCGIPEEHLPRIFERFYRVDKARSRQGGGTGLGLSIVKHYLHALEGEIDVQSQPGAGSTFTVKIPSGASKD